MMTAAAVTLHHWSEKNPQDNSACREASDKYLVSSVPATLCESNVPPILLPVEKMYENGRKIAREV